MNNQKLADLVKDFLIQLRGANLRFQKECETPMGELTSLLAIQQMCADRGRISLSGLGNRLKLSRPAVSRMVHSLKEKGYIELHPGKEDHRYLYVNLADKGMEVIQTETGRCSDLICQMAEEMGEEELNSFFYYNRKFYSLLLSRE